MGQIGQKWFKFPEVKYQIPIIAVCDNKNREITHNANRVRNLNIGISVKLKFNVLSQFSLNKMINLLNDKNQLDSFSKEISKHNVGGDRFAANIILKELYHEFN